MPLDRAEFAMGAPLSSMSGFPWPKTPKLLSPPSTASMPVVKLPQPPLVKSGCRSLTWRGGLAGIDRLYTPEYASGTRGLSGLTGI
jgi:hypothetical protein